MRGFEHRIQLPHVLDDVHRRTVIRTMARVGIAIERGSWDELEKASIEFSKRLEGDELLTVKYDGAHSFGPILGEAHHLIESSTTLYAAHQNGHLELGQFFWQREIHIGSRHSRLEVPSRILLFPDSPPVAVHGDDYGYVVSRHSVNDTVSDSQLLEEVKKAFGSEAVELVDEGTAEGIIDALQNDTTQNGIIA